MNRIERKRPRSLLARITLLAQCKKSGCFVLRVEGSMHQEQSRPFPLNPSHPYETLRSGCPPLPDRTVH
jgi:hypothetical protein